MTTKNFSSYSPSELQEMLRILKGYRASLKQIGSRTVLFDPKQSREKILRVEYVSGVDKNFLENFSTAVYQKFFPEIPTNSPKVFVENNKILGGIRLFYGDDMVDLSFQDFVRSVL